MTDGLTVVQLNQFELQAEPMQEIQQSASEDHCKKDTSSKI